MPILSSSLKFPSRHGRRQGGFVLVAVLLLIALATVLIVTTSSVSRIESKAVSNSSKEEVARQNALYALQIAVAQIQSAAGPDQRVTATADILNSNSITPSPVKHPFWTGVWKTFNPAWLNDSARTAAPGSSWFRPQPLDVSLSGQSTPTLRSWSTASAGSIPTNVTWLVSMPSGSSPITVNPLTWLTNSTNSVLLATNWGTNTAANAVYVPLVTTTNTVGVAGRTITNTGAYAYWVSDEGVKAKVSITDTNLTTATISSANLLIPGLVHSLGSAVPNISSVVTNYGITTALTSDFRSNTNLAKVTGLADLAFASNGVPAFTNNNLAADLTVSSYGVLCDVRRGGLRQDLTAAFESTSTAASTNFTALTLRSGSGSGNDAYMVYRAQNQGIPALTTTIPAVSGGSVLDGLRWQSLYWFYNNYKATMPVSPVTTVTGGTAPGGVGTPSTSGANTIAARDPYWKETIGTTASFVMGTMAPACIADRIDAGITGAATTVKVGTNTAPGYTFQVRYYPMVTLYNPYAVNLTIPSSAVIRLEKNALNKINIVLTCQTNGAYCTITNASWQFQTTTTNPVTGNVTTNTNSAPSQTITNLFPINTGNGVGSSSVPPTQLYQGSTYPLNMYCTNWTTMAPGEIRVFALASPVTATSMSNAIAFYNLVSSPSTTLDAYAAYTFNTVNTNWGGTTNAAGVVNFGFGTGTSQISTTASNSLTYNESRLDPANITTWPGANTPTSITGFTYDMPSGPPSAGGSVTNQGGASLVAAGTIGQLAGGTVYRMVGIYERLKGTFSTSTTGYINSSSNIPLFMGNSFNLNSFRSGSATFMNSQSPVTETYAISGAQYSSIPLNTYVSGSILTTSWLNNGVGSASVNAATTSANNSSIVLRDVTIAPMTSLGQFMHLEDNVLGGASGGSQVTYTPGMSIGGSFACPETGISSTAYFGALTSGSYPYSWDVSYMANEALFDTYFFSTVPPAAGFSWGGGSYPPFNQTLSPASIAQRQPLPNFRYQFYFKNGTNPSVGDLQNESKAAANLLLDGAFNVNSTSVAAWKALLTSLGGRSYGAYNYLQKQFQTKTPKFPVPRFWSVFRSSPNDPWEGMRDLTDAQVTALAQEIVKQVRLRGPFLSVADFLNRRLSTTASQLSYMGALQAAIENTAKTTAGDVNLNIHSAANLWNTTTSCTLSTNVPTPVNVANYVTNTATGIPGYLMQQDLVQAFAPVLSARSDTFMIRVYGRADRYANGVSKTEAQAWGEAVVQRLPDYYDQSDPALSSTTVVPGLGYSLGDATPPLNSSGLTLGSLNQTFGRRFKVVSFRWLNANEL